MITKLLTRDISLILAASFFYMACPMMVTPLIAGFSESLGASAVLMGLVGGMMNVVSLCCRPFVGNLADKISKYRLSTIGSLLMIVACVGYIFAPTPAVVVGARIINGVGFSLCSVCMATWISSLLPKERVGAGMGLYGTMNALAMAIAPALGIAVYGSLGYRAAFVLATVLAVAVVVTVQLVHDKGEVVQKSAPAKGRGSFVARDVLPVAAIIMLFAIPYCATQSFLVSYIAARDLAVHAGWFFPLYAIILLVLRLSLADLFDKKPFVFFLAGSSVSALIAILLLAVMQNNLVLFVAAAFMAGGYGIMCSVCQSTAILLVGEEKRGLANSTYYIGFDLGMALGPIIGGFLYGHVSLAYFYPVLALCVPASVIVYVLNRRRFRKV